MRTERALTLVAAGLLLVAAVPDPGAALELRRPAFVSADYVQNGNTTAHVVAGDVIQGVSEADPLTLWHGFLGPRALLLVDVPPGSVAPEIALAAPYPNPCASSCTIRFRAPPGERVAVGIFDLAGRRVQRLGLEDASGPERTVIWRLDGRDRSRVAPGLYFVRLEGVEPRLTRSIAVTR